MSFISGIVSLFSWIVVVLISGILTLLSYHLLLKEVCRVVAESCWKLYEQVRGRS